MNQHRRAARALLACVLALAACVSVAQSPQSDPAAIQAVIEEAKARLKLTPEQEAQLKPIVQDRNQKLKAIRDKYSGETSRSAKRAMFKEAQPVIENYQARVRTILSEEQEVEWEKMRAEAKERLKEQYKSGNGPH
jgi:cell division protein ZapA (FtsZ GTPase activity inhibitor)